MQRAQQIGKAVLTQPSSVARAPDGCDLLSGGMGALGLVTTQMMAEEGAKSMVLMSRRGAVGPNLQAQWEHLQTFSVDLQIKACDVANMESVQVMVRALRKDWRRGRRAPVSGACCTSRLCWTTRRCRSTA